MVEGKFRSRTKRRVFVRTPSGKVVLHHRDRKPGKTICGGCGDVLKGVPHAKPAVLRNMAKSEKKPERPYGGNLCSKCTRKKVLEKWLK